jgi:hypothetical protein
LLEGKAKGLGPFPFCNPAIRTFAISTGGDAGQFFL